MKHILSIVVLVLAGGQAQGVIIPNGKNHATGGSIGKVEQFTNDIKILRDALDAAYNFEVQAVNDGMADIKSRQESKQLQGATQQQIDAVIKDLTDQKNKLSQMRNGLEKVLNQAAQAPTKQAAQDLVKQFISNDKIIKKADYQDLIKNGLAFVQSKGLVGANIARLEHEYFDIKPQGNTGKYTL